MELAVNKLSALRVLRSLRRAGRFDATRAHDLPAPDCAPRTRWTPGLLPLDALALSEAPSADRSLDVAVPSAPTRLQASFARCTVYSKGLPKRSFIEVDGGIFIPCPELVFVELADVMPLAVHILLGYELCGTYARDAADPRDGQAAFGLPAVTSTARIAAFIDSCRGVRGCARARASLAFVADNAWSPMEALVAAMASLPGWECGYGLTGVSLNVRHDNPDDLVQMGCAGSRVPDIEIAHTRVGLNYDGHGHFDLAGMAGAQDMGDAARQAKAARAKYVDDLRRNRELAAQGLAVLPVVAEDLYRQGGLDEVMLEVAQAAEAMGGAKLGDLRKLLRVKALKRSRQDLLWSLLPGQRGRQLAREEARKGASGNGAIARSETSIVF